MCIYCAVGRAISTSYSCRLLTAETIVPGQSVWDLVLDKMTVGHVFVPECIVSCRVSAHRVPRTQFSVI